MAEKDDAEQHGHIARAEDVTDQSAGKRYGSEPEEAHDRTEKQDGDFVDRGDDEKEENRCTRQVETA